MLSTNQAAKIVYFANFHSILVYDVEFVELCDLQRLLSYRTYPDKYLHTYGWKKKIYTRITNFLSIIL